MKLFITILTYCIFSELVSAAPSLSRVEQLELQIHNLSRIIQHLQEERNSVSPPHPNTNNIINENEVPKRCCMEILEYNSKAVSGLYRVAPTDGKGEFTVCCDMTTGEGGWTVIQKRNDNSTDFYRNWQQYKTGFGAMDGNFWLGLEKIYRLTQLGTHEIMFLMDSHDNQRFIAKYGLFKVDSEVTGYQLQIGKYIESESNAGDSLAIHKNLKFSTYDRDNDASPSENCAEKYHGAWWYKHCYESNLNGRYYNGNYGNYDGSNPSAMPDGIVWYGAQGWWHSLKTITIVIKPALTKNV